MTNYNQPTPPPYIAPRRPTQSYGEKIVKMGLICAALMFCVLAIWVITASRESTNKDVAESIAEQWGRNVYITGPTVMESLDSADWLRPSSFDCQAEVATQSLHRGIYEAEVFKAGVKISGTFNRDSLRLFGDTVVVELGVTTKQLTNLGALKIGRKEIPWNKSDHFLFATVNTADMPETVDFSTDFEVKGSEGIFIKQIGERNSITINGEASNPSFDGYSLPTKRTLRKSRFSAKWEDVAPDGVTYTDNFGFVGTNFLVGVDRYQKVERSMKYSFIIIVLTFISVLFVEIMRKQPIPLLNYFLVGAALILFYSLLLSFAELISFGMAYLIAAAMTIALITGYMWKMLRSRELGLSIGGVLSLIYLICFILISISTYALLLGSLLLFIALAAMMYASLKLKHN